MVSYYSDIGNYRKINEDYIGHYEGEFAKVYIVADGMGGHNAGEVASSMAVKSVVEYIKLNDNKDIKLRDCLEESIHNANSSIFKKAMDCNNLNGMGTTITALIHNNDKYYVANVGDSSAFVIKNKELVKITKDHSLVQQLLDEGTITEEEAKRHPNRNIITRALGTNSNVKVDIFEISDYDKVILCTDGLTNELTNEEILNICINCKDTQRVAYELVIRAKNTLGKDNISTLVVGGGL